MRWLLCLLGWHERSRGKAHDDGHAIVSVCRHCEKPMRRLRNGTWQVTH